jgi:two-component system, NtrC family, sensor kinase
MTRVRIGRRLVVVLLLAFTPVVAISTYWTVQWSSQTYIAGLRRETEATMRGIAPVLTDYAQQGQRARVEDFFQRMSADGTNGALLKANGELWYAAHDFPRELIVAATRTVVSGDSLEFEQRVEDRYWFCLIRPLSPGQQIGYLVVANDWTNIGENLREKMLLPIGAALIVIALTAVLIPIAVRLYVSKPLAELSRKVMRFSTDNEIINDTGDELKLLDDEFERLDRQLTIAHAELLARHRYELELNRRLQRADRLATIGTLASGLAHEIGTPMGVMRTRTELLLQGRPTPEKTREGLEIIHGQIERISKIVRMLLDYARGRESRRVRNDLRIIIEHVMKLVDAQAKRSNVRIVLQPSADPLMVQCDPDQLQQVFVNLAINAFDAMAPDGGTLTVNSSIDRNRNISLVRVSFQDTGCGVPAEFRDRLFDPFFTTKPPGKGTGMGLSVSQSIIRDHNGELTFEAESAGARFSVELPMAEALIASDESAAAQMERQK